MTVMRTFSYEIREKLEFMQRCTLPPPAAALVYNKVRQYSSETRFAVLLIK